MLEKVGRVRQAVRDVLADAGLAGHSVRADVDLRHEAVRRLVPEGAGWPGRLALDALQLRLDGVDVAKLSPRQWDGASK